MTADASTPAKPTPFDWVRLALAVAFALGVAVYTWLTVGHLSGILVVAAVFGAYMAMNIGANDVANNVGPAVGGRVMTLAHAIVIAAIFEALGAIIAGGEVVGTIKSGIIDPAAVPTPQAFVWLMTAALLAAALWLNFATWIGAPVSTTHSIVGAVLGSGIAASGWDIANWSTVGQIAASWVVSPVFGGVLAALILYAIKRSITYQPDLMEAARRGVPVLIGLMAWAFASYLLLKGLTQLVKVGFWPALAVGLMVGVVTYTLMRRRVRARLHALSNDKDGVNLLFTVPLMFAAALLSFAHGSNDVANAIGPLAAIHDTLSTSNISGKAPVPLWIMLIGALGLSVGLALYGPKLIRTVGTEITEMDPMRAYCIAMSAALTVIIASQLGLPISTTHVTIGAVFGVGFLREYLKANYARIIAEIEAHHQAQDSEREVVEAFLKQFEAAPVAEKGRMLRELKQQGRAGTTQITREERKTLRREYRHDLVKRSVVMKVIAAWIVTVPVSALLSAVVYYALRGALLP